MADVEFEDYTIKVQGELDDRIFAVLEECAGELESAAKRNSRVDTGQTKNSFQHKVTGSFMAGKFRAYIGSDSENAIWEEFGTGEYAIAGNGRKGGWVYPNPKARYNKNGKLRKGSKGFFFTLGKRPSRAFWNAYNSKKSAIIKHIQDSFGGL